MAKTLIERSETIKMVKANLKLMSQVISDLRADAEHGGEMEELEGYRMADNYCGAASEELTSADPYPSERHI